MKILVLGGSGFIGRRLVSHLVKQECSVTIVSRSKPFFPEPVHIVKADLLNSSFQFLLKQRFDAVVNCAAELSDKETMKELHVSCPMRMLRLLKNRSCRWIQLSSVGVYGPVSSGVVDESADLKPVGCYEETKAMGDQVIFEYCQANHIPVTILRPSNVFGSEMPNKSLQRLIRFIQKGWFFYLANPDLVSMNYIHVDNVVQAIWLSITHPRADGQVYNLSDNVSQSEFISIICRQSQTRVPISYIPHSCVKGLAVFLKWVPYFPLTDAAINFLSTEAVYSRSKIERELGFELDPRLAEGLQRYLIR